MRTPSHNKNDYGGASARRTSGRRPVRTIGATLAGILAVSVGVTGSAGASATAQSQARTAAKHDYVIKTPVLEGGAGSVLAEYMVDSKLDLKYHIQLKPIVAPTPEVLNTEMASNEYAVAYNEFDSTITLAEKGVSVNLLATLAPTSSVVIGRHSLKAPATLSGKSIAGITASGTWKTFSAVLKTEYGFTVNSQASPMAATNGGSVGTEFDAGTATYAWSWEPSASEILHEVAGSKVVLDTNKIYSAKHGYPLWQFFLLDFPKGPSLPHPAIVDFVKLWQAAAKKLDKKPKLAAAAAKGQGFTPGIFEEAIDSGRLHYEVHPLDGKVRSEVETQLKMDRAYAGQTATPLPSNFIKSISLKNKKK